MASRSERAPIVGGPRTRPSRGHCKTQNQDGAKDEAIDKATPCRAQRHVHLKSHKDMIEIDSEVIEHRLCLNPESKKVQQK